MAYILLTTTGCTLGKQASNIFSSVFTEAQEGYENVKTEVGTKTSAVKEEIDKINQAAADIGDAASAVGEAIDSVQAIGGDPATEGTEEVTETTGS